jgi:hypothetical protein
MCVAQTMTPTLFGRRRDRWSRWLWTAILYVMASLRACFLQSEAHENGDPKPGMVTPGPVRRDPADGGVRGETPMSEQM